MLRQLKNVWLETSSSKETLALAAALAEPLAEPLDGRVPGRGTCIGTGTTSSSLE